MKAALLADAVVLVHLAYVGFVAVGFVAVPAGCLLGWRWVRNRTFRRLHVAAIALVAVEGLVGLVCPLTWLEAMLRGGGRPDSFMGRLVHTVLFYEAPAWIFTVAYVALTALAVLLYWRCPPQAGARS